MIAILSITVTIFLLSAAVFQMVRNHRTSGYVDARSELIPRVLIALSIMSACGTICGMADPLRLLSDSVIAVLSISPLVLSVRPAGRLPFHIGPFPAIIPIMTLYYLLCIAGILKLFSSQVFLVSAGLMSVCLSCFYLWMIWRRLRDIKSVMKSGHVWAYVTLCVDAVYVLAPAIIMTVMFSIYVIFSDISEILAAVAVVLLLFEVLAVVVRIAYDSAFVILNNHERVIVESMKLSHSEVATVTDNRGEDQYKELYERIVLYFEMSKPYLDGDLTINDVVKVVYSNKVYISKAICHYTGRNFRQFVNYYRVIYSMDLFRANLEYKVAELAEKSGFNTMVSYTMAFRLFMNETPSEWCRKERSKILKRKK